MLLAPRVQTTYSGLNHEAPEALKSHQGIPVLRLHLGLKKQNG